MPQHTRLEALADERLSAADKGLPARASGLTVREFLATGPRLAEFWTPLLALDARALARNAAVVQGWCSERGLELMPHGKTTMAPALWQLQLDHGATGLTLATPGQVRTARSFGIASIMLANTLVAPAALEFIAGELADPAFSFHSWADSVETVEAMELGLEGVTLPRPIDVLVELGGAGGRTGARGAAEAVRVAERIAASPVLRLAGTAGYEGSLGHDRSPAALEAVRAYLAEMLEVHEAVRGLVHSQMLEVHESVRDLADGELIVTAGGSAYLELVAEVFAPSIAAESAAAEAAGRTRWILRSGASLLHDDGFYRGISPIDGELTPAMRGYARVVSHPEPGLALLDGGKRDFPYDEGLPVPFGVAGLPGGVERPLAGASVTALNDQHAYLRADASLDLAIGEVVSLGLSHPCTAFDKWRLIPVVEGGGSDLVVALVRTYF